MTFQEGKELLDRNADPSWIAPNTWAFRHGWPTVKAMLPPGTHIGRQGKRKVYFTDSQDGKFILFWHSGPTAMAQIYDDNRIQAAGR